ncbi:DUF4291 domain-containing protein [Arenibacter certesii]|uniref:DUF4291 domain-containing protein n=1 Tax=Arenibacter certesii TaxID=228955 RepID=A0A918MRS3_9FLAO|nr:DUF4291 domain-containing protein [Arenibacter certesii]GGW49157.1 hypothetical protein GCM10007383_36400 [Arenibacter certesii]
MEDRIIRAVFDEETITVYQAYRPEITNPALINQRFVPPFKMERMTWIKPSFLWMMYRCGWTQKEGQEHVLAIKIKREGWEWAVKNACLSHFVKEIDSSTDEWKETLRTAPVRIQWDPERDIFLNNLDYRSIQVGLTGIAVEKFVNDWIVSIEDISEKCRHIHSLVLNKKIVEAKQLLPLEKVYPLPNNLKIRIHYSS